MYGGLIAVYSGLIAVCTVGLLETYVGGSDSSVHGGLQGMHLEVESNLNKSGEMEGEAGVRHRRARACRQRASSHMRPLKEFLACDVTHARHLRCPQSTAQ